MVFHRRRSGVASRIVTTVGMNPRTRPRRFKRGNSRNIDSLPNELLLEILVRLSADDIYENARVVCRRWYNLIHGDDFVYAHLHRISCGLLLPGFRDTTRDRAPYFVAATQGGIEISKLSCKIRFVYLASCNGLVLGRERDILGKYALCIVNPATKRRVNLPRFFDRGVFGMLGGIAYDAASMKYKVAATYPVNSFLVQCAILTVGVDNTWRRIAIEQLSPRAKGLLFRTPLITEGFMHWPSSKGNDVLTLNVETEIITETPVPLPRDRGCKYYYLSTGRYLSLLMSCGDSFLWEVWEMKPETGEWRKLLRNINLEAHMCRIPWLSLEDKDDSSIFPVGWVKYPELLAFFDEYVDCSCIIYKLDTDEIDSIVLPAHSSMYSVVVHMNSLVWLS